MGMAIIRLGVYSLFESLSNRTMASVQTDQHYSLARLLVVNSQCTLSATDRNGVSLSLYRTTGPKIAITKVSTFYQHFCSGAAVAKPFAPSSTYFSDARRVLFLAGTCAGFVRRKAYCYRRHISIGRWNNCAVEPKGTHILC